MSKNIGILSDAHGNFLAFRSAIANLKLRGATKFFFLGDALGYLPSLGVLEEIFDLEDEIFCVRGNHEDQILKNVRSPHENVYQHDVIRATLSMHQKRAISMWPTSIETTFDGVPVLLVHGSADDPLNGYIYPNSPLKELPQFRFVFMGNTHRPFIRSCGKTMFVNVGSCGLPRDHGAYGSAAIYSVDSKTVEIIRFDISLETRLVADGIPYIHKAVRDLWSRKESRFVGELL